VLPVILANTIAYLLSRALQPVPIFEIFTHQDGLFLPSMEEQREESNLHIEDALRPVAVPVLQGSDTLAAAAGILAQYSNAQEPSAILIHCHKSLWYAATRQEIDSLLAASTADPAALPVESSASTPQNLNPNAILEQCIPAERTPVLFPDLPLASALPHFSRWPLLPITNRAVRGALEGAISMDDVLKRYQGR
jgi:CIC family chloride channel protein